MTQPTANFTDVEPNRGYILLTLCIHTSIGSRRIFRLFANNICRVLLGIHDSVKWIA